MDVSILPCDPDLRPRLGTVVLGRAARAVGYCGGHDGHDPGLHGPTLDPEGHPCAGFCSITVPAGDGRVAALQKELATLGESASMRLDRRYSNRELDQFPWLQLVVATAGLMGGVNYRQPYDRAGAVYWSPASMRSSGTHFPFSFWHSVLLVVGLRATHPDRRLTLLRFRKLPG